ncbi:hypothetical protein CXG81DRAFT_8936 [Caulochytrium protostelioides]|uniref:histidine kinase n=1 Tax=Caulochytrium protostelioides TaxID=1555241 RepID=A0A4V1IVG1_9FUNG|nr:hypothetical protein CXG81DRAFT_8936 [Caulochytrium protostelioides]|eukprot:RKP03939.1 hypothetical protein CXG81DRAFT_8936 [Caulochytrium protostelioides]
MRRLSPTPRAEPIARAAVDPRTPRTRLLFPNARRHDSHEIGEYPVPTDLHGVWREIRLVHNARVRRACIQVREITRVMRAISRGDLSQTLSTTIGISQSSSPDVRDLAQTVDFLSNHLRAFADEVTRVSLEVGVEGRLGGQAVVTDVDGIWKEVTENVNLMAANLTSQVRSIAIVTTAVARGDLTKKITIEVRGEFYDLSQIVNGMVDQLRTFASEVTRVAREVGTEGRLGGQAVVKDVGGIWLELTENVNLMAANLTSQVRSIAMVTTAVARGDLTGKVTSIEVGGEFLDLSQTVNDMVDQLRTFASEVTRVAREVGTEGRLGGQAVVKDVGGIWLELTENVNLMAANLTTQVRSIAMVTTAVARGDLTGKVTIGGEFLDLSQTVNDMVDQLRTFASEVTRVAREVGTEGRLGGQAVVKDVDGIWLELTDNVNRMAENLTSQVRSIAMVTTAVARGDLTKKITIEVRGEFYDLSQIVNGMVDQLRTFASEVTRVAREVGTEGRLGGQAVVKDVGGIWLELTENVNMMAANLTSQVRSIAMVTTAVARGDLTGKVTSIEVRGEFYDLSQIVNRMVDQLRTFASEVTRVAREVGTEGRLGGQAVVKDVGGIWLELTNQVNFMAANLTSQVRSIAMVTTAVARGDLSKMVTVEVRGELAELKTIVNGMIMQLRTFASEVTRVAREVGTEGKLGAQAQVEDVEGTWASIIFVVNLMARNLTSQLRGFADITAAATDGDFSRIITVEAKGELDSLKERINCILINLRDKMHMLRIKTDEQRRRAEEAEEAKRQLEDYVDMVSHEIRGPTSSIMQSADLMHDDLISLRHHLIHVVTLCSLHQKAIADDVLNVSKITMNLLVFASVDFQPEQELSNILRIFAKEAQSKKYELRSQIDRESLRRRDAEWVNGDPLRLSQILINLISNAVRFLRKTPDAKGPSCLCPPDKICLTFSVCDNGIGMSPEEQRQLFGRFAQASPRTTVDYGGSGLGLFISRRLVELQGGAIRVRSEKGVGTSFDFFIICGRASKNGDEARAVAPSKGAGSPAEGVTGASGPTSSFNENGQLQIPHHHHHHHLHVDEAATSSPAAAAAAAAATATATAGSVPSAAAVPAHATPRHLELESQLRSTASKGQASHGPAGSRTPLSSTAGGPPARRVDASDGHGGQGHDSAVGSQRLRVLIVEDNKVNQRVLQRHLEKMGHATGVANHGRECLEILQANPTTFDLLFTDLNMPIMSGLEATRAIRQFEADGVLPPHPPIPIIGVSGNARDKYREAALDAGMDDFLTKPYTRQQLHDVIAMHGHRRLLGGAPEWPAAATPTANGIASPTAAAATSTAAAMGEPALNNR